MSWIWNGLSILFSGLIGLFYLQTATRRIAEGDRNTETDFSGKRSKAPERKRMLVSLACLIAMSTVSVLMLDFFCGASVWDCWSSTLLLACLWGCAYADRREKLIPNQILLWAGLLRLVMIAARAILSPEELRYEVLGSLVGALAVFIAALLCRLLSRGALGFGDVKLLTLMGFYLTTSRIWGSIFFSMICCFFYSGFLLVRRKADIHTEIPFAPLLLAGTVLSYFLTGV